MSPSNESQPHFESRFPELKLPEEGWRSTIPSHLLEGCDEQTKWLLEEISKNTQATNFACHAVVDVSKHLRTLNGRTYKSEKAVSEVKQEVEVLRGQAKAVSPFMKPITMFANLWEYTFFKWLFVGGLVFFIGILYPLFLSSSFVSWLRVFLGS